mmetsp:Transcript_49536/g.137343  ORF Transcript_49536/g.137343 Transcript_49536/m.137343 type:complete len:223 (-) Transcript_49536:263-931(-)
MSDTFCPTQALSSSVSGGAASSTSPSSRPITSLIMSKIDMRIGGTSTMRWSSVAALIWTPGCMGSSGSEDTYLTVWSMASRIGRIELEVTVGIQWCASIGTIAARTPRLARDSAISTYWSRPHMKPGTMTTEGRDGRMALLVPPSATTQCTAPPSSMVGSPTREAKRGTSPWAAIRTELAEQLEGKLVAATWNAARGVTKQHRIDQNRRVRSSTATRVIGVS